MFTMPGARSRPRSLMTNRLAAKMASNTYKANILPIASTPQDVTLVSPANTIRGNITGSPAVRQDFTIDGLTLKGTVAAADEIIIWDVAGTAIKKANASSFGGVTSIAGNTGTFTLGAGLTNATNVLLVDAYGLNMVNGTLVQSQAANAQTFAVKTLAGNDPSASDPVLFQFRNVTAATGNYVVRQVTAALSITIPAGQTMGFVNATPGRVWIGALDNAGTVELFVINALVAAAGSVATYPLQGWGIISTSAVSGASSTLTPYSTTARSSLAYVTLGYATWETGGTLATAGTWNAAPTRMQLFQAGSVPLPGQPVQSNSSVISAASTTSSATYVALTSQQISITPTSSANVIAVTANGSVTQSTGQTNSLRLSRGTTAATNLIGNEAVANNLSTVSMTLSAYDFPATMSAQTYAVQGKTTAGTLTYSNTPTFILAQEIMG
jgi:hypothetical protein